MNLRDLTKAEMKKTSEIILSFPWENPKAYAMWLAQTYYMVCHSTRLVALAGAHCTLEQNSLHARFVDHSKEERGHEKIAISDIQALGYKLSDFPQVFQSAAMYQVQYYWVQFRGPVSFFGYTLGLEMLACEFGPEIHRRVHEAHGAKASKFLKLHSEDDVEHTASAFQQMDLLKEEERKLVSENLHLSCDIYRGMLNEIKDYMRNMETQKAG